MLGTQIGPRLPGPRLAGAMAQRTLRSCFCVGVVACCTLLALLLVTTNQTSQQRQDSNTLTHSWRGQAENHDGVRSSNSRSHGGSGSDNNSDPLATESAERLQRDLDGDDNAEHPALRYLLGQREQSLFELLVRNLLNIRDFLRHGFPSSQKPPAPPPGFSLATAAASPPTNPVHLSPTSSSPSLSYSSLLTSLSTSEGKPTRRSSFASSGAESPLSEAAKASSSLHRAHLGQSQTVQPDAAAREPTTAADQHILNGAKPPIEPSTWLSANAHGADWQFESAAGHSTASAIDTCTPLVDKGYRPGYAKAARNGIASAEAKCSAVIFLHIPKTGGTALRQVLSSNKQFYQVSVNNPV